VEQIAGDNIVQEIKLRNVKTGEVSTLELNGIFVAVGIVPNTQCFTEAIEINGTGYIITDDLMATSAPGIFAAGDARDDSARQVATAVGDGATAASSVNRYLQEKGG